MMMMIDRLAAEDELVIGFAVYILPGNRMICSLICLGRAMNC